MPILLQSSSNIDTLWQAWLTGTPLPPPQDKYAHWHNRLIEDAQQLLAPFPPESRSQIPLLLATTKGDIDSQCDWMRSIAPDIANPPPKSILLQDQAAALAQTLGTAPSRIISTACSSGITAFIDATFTLLDNAAPQVLVAAIDVASPFVRDGFHALKALADTCKPFDQNRNGLTLGSWAGACLLSQGASTADAIAITGWGVSSDAIHLTAPDREARGLTRAIEQALEIAQLQPTAIDAILAHGTGTRFNDAMEAIAIETIFLRQNARPSITAVKGLIGHTLGASGLVETLLAAKMLEQQIVPPITNLQTPEYPDLPLVIRTPQRRPLRHILKIASGFGGLNAAIILSRGGAS